MQKKIATIYSNEKPESKNAFARLLKKLFTYNTSTRKRIWELDIFRGILMIFVTLDHVCMFGVTLGIFNFQTEFGQFIADFAKTYTNSAFRCGIQPFGLFLFCYLSGINCSFTQSKFKRVLKMWIFCAIYMGTASLLHLLIPDFVISFLIFNIIAVITICVSVWWLLDLIKCPTWIRFSLAVAIICTGLTYFFMYFIRDFSYINNNFMALLVYNRHGYELSRNNFEPLFPHLGWFLLGGVMGKYIYKERKTLTKQEEPFLIFRPIAYIGKHSLAVYIIGTVLILALAFGIKELVALFL